MFNTIIKHLDELQELNKLHQKMLSCYEKASHQRIKNIPLKITNIDGKSYEEMANKLNDIYTSNKVIKPKPAYEMYLKTKWKIKCDLTNSQGPLFIKLGLDPTKFHHFMTAMAELREAGLLTESVVNSVLESIKGDTKSCLMANTITSNVSNVESNECNGERTLLTESVHPSTKLSDTNYKPKVVDEDDFAQLKSQILAMQEQLNNIQAIINIPSDKQNLT